MDPNIVIISEKGFLMKSLVAARQSPHSNLSCPEDKKWIWVVVFSLPSSLDFGQGGEDVFSFP